MREQLQNEFCGVPQKLALQVAIDGPAASGKSTIARELAAALCCTYLDTGLMYRAVTHLAMVRGVSMDSEEALVQLARSTSFQTTQSVQDSILVNGECMGSNLRSPAIDATVSSVSAMPRLRASLVERQRELARGMCIIMVGRDIGTVVLPKAHVKLWVTASAHARARRRIDQMVAPSGDTVDMMREKIEARDRTDANRTTSPLTRAQDAIDINTEGATVSESVQQALSIIGATMERLQAGPHLREK